MPTYRDLLKVYLLSEERQVPPGKKYLALFDIDDTLLKANNIFIHKKTPDGKITKLTPDEYSKEKVVEERARGVVYSYEEFRDPKKVKESIESGTPIWKNLRIFNDHLKAGWEVGIITARGLEDVIYNSISNWLMFQKEKGLIPSLAKPLARNIVYAISDEIKKYEGATDFDKKANVVKKAAASYDRVKVIDDDDKNIKAIRGLNLKNVIVVKSWKHE